MKPGGGAGGVAAAAGKEEPAASGMKGRRVDSKQGAGSSGSALRSFLDHVPVTAIPGLNNSSLPEVKFDDCVEHAIRLLYENNVSHAPIVDSGAPTLFRKSMDRDVGFIELSSMILWSLEEIGKVKAEPKGNDLGLLDVLANDSQVEQTKIVALAKSFIWEPFFPVTDNDTLFHLLLLFTTHHRLNVIPVVRSSNSSIIGFITQNAVARLLLQSSGLQWFDEIAEKRLSEFGLINSAGVASIYSDQSLEDALHMLWLKELNQVPVLDRVSEKLTGCVRRSDVHLLLEDDSLFNNRKVLTAEQFIDLGGAGSDGSSNDHSTTKELPAAGLLRLKYADLPRTGNPVVIRKSDSLKKVMESMVASMSETGFLVSDSDKLEGTVTLRDMLLPFSPPSMDSRLDGGCFFQSLLNQAGCHVHDGEMIRNS